MNRVHFTKCEGNNLPNFIKAWQFVHNLFPPPPPSQKCKGQQHEEGSTEQ